MEFADEMRRWYADTGCLGRIAATPVVIPLMIVIGVLSVVCILLSPIDLLGLGLRKALDGLMDRFYWSGGFGKLLCVIPVILIGALYAAVCVLTLGTPLIRRDA